MTIHRVRTAVAAAGLSALLAGGLAGGPAAPASAAPVSPVAVPAATWSATPFPGKSPAAILALSVSTAKKATGVRVKGILVQGTEKDTVDGVLQKTAARVTISSSTSGTFTLLRVGSAVYLGGDAKFWTTSADAATAKALVGKWVTVSGTDADAKELRSQTTIAYWVNDVAALKVTRRVAGKTIRKLPTIGLVDPSASGGTVFVATKGKPYPVQVVSTDRKSTLTFFDWNKRVTIKPPPAKLIVTI